MDNLMYEKKNAYEVLASDELEKAKVFCEGKAAHSRSQRLCKRLFCAERGRRKRL